MKTTQSISIAEFLAAAPDEQRELAARAAALYEQQRYLVIVDHGIPDELFTRVPEIAAPFFAAPLERKLEHLARTGLGYLPSPDSLDLPVANNPNSPHEQFILHLDPSKNPWPTEPADFRAVVSAYNRKAEQLCRLLARIMALGVGIPVERVTESDDAPNISFLKFINWATPAPDTRVGEYRLAPHFDNAAVSLLKNPASANGLQVRRGNEWVEAWAPPEALVALFGEQLANWTEGRVSPSWHQIVEHQADYDGPRSRLSSCYFYNPEPMLESVELYLAGRVKYCQACDAALRGESIDRQTWTRRFRWSSASAARNTAPTSSATQKPMSRQPAISLAPLFDGDDRQKKRLADELLRIYEAQRYVCVRDHGMSEGLAKETELVAHRYFLTPLEHKLEQLARTGLGYLPSPVLLGMPASKVSRNEVFLAHRDPARNPWPSQPAAFEATVAAYNLQAEALSHVLLRAFAIALGRPEHHFSEQVNASASFLKLFRFPRPAPDDSAGEYRLAGHHDYSAVSIIRCAEAPNGLQTLSASNEWLDVYPDPDSVVVFAGEQMTRWTDGRVPPSWHRVENPSPDHAGDGSRTSTCYFFNPECMAGDVEGYFDGRAEFAKACADHLSGRAVERNDWESPARRI
ncbi:2OG-Fe(II) oxygenase family protein [Enhygromyxa salina]|uniref:2-oxoglutarate-dependent ethylene/succinate-forming enzyme n=1 Tax=Enhygromyxa salina TaxID=215803 RepID=A0A2S9Y5Q8_9BACT|nr:2OG-Fe(II) oxygenase family protein [Enhygromyxa salina]PRQ00447.1 Deacetoxycephalosporin C synthase [Enhygromyxa salina]